MVCVICLVCEKTAGWLYPLQQGGGDADVGNVAWRQDEGDRFALSVGQSVDLAGPSAT